MKKRKLYKKAVVVEYSCGVPNELIIDDCFNNTAKQIRRIIERRLNRVFFILNTTTKKVVYLSTENLEHFYILVVE